MMSSMKLRGTITGLISFVASEEEMLLQYTERSRATEGSPEVWAAVPLVAHNTEFKRQQVCRLEAVARGTIPTTFKEVDHRSHEVYEQYSRRPLDEVRAEHRAVTTRLIDLASQLSDADLLDPSRHEWLSGRKLWLQVVVRGFWHPAGHLGEFYLTHDENTRALSLARHALGVTQYLEAPDDVVAMGAYNLACAYARAGLLDEAADAITLAVEKNPEFREKFRHEPDLEALRDSGRLSETLGT
jgi:hypothetical protein